MTKVLLYSGGTDSWLIDKIWKPDIKLYINTHGMYSAEEMANLPKNVRIFDMPFLGSIEEEETAYIPMRNLYFLMIASNYGDHICFGATGADIGTRDKDDKFITLTQELFDHMLKGNSFTDDRNVHIERQFLEDGKYSLVKKYLEAGGDIKTFIESTFACHHPIDGKECMYCKPCSKKFLLGYYYGYQYTNEQLDNMVDYVQTYILPRNGRRGTYFADRPKDGPYDVESVVALLTNRGISYEHS